MLLSIPKSLTLTGPSTNNYNYSKQINPKFIGLGRSQRAYWRPHLNVVEAKAKAKANAQQAVSGLQQQAAKVGDLKQEEVIIIDGLRPAILTPPKDLKRSDFDNDFLFGNSTSALQTEGPGIEGGRGPSTWDGMINAPEGGMGTNSYNLFKEDVKLLKQMGMNSYRFSFSWPRILPDGNVEFGEINQAGIEFYHKFLDELIANDITPVVTLFHFDLPVTLQDNYHGFLDERIIEDFKRYAEICFENFGKKVKIWSTINEPFVFGSYGYRMGLTDQDLVNDPMSPYKATHNIILAHAAAVQAYRDYREKEQITDGKIGISLPCRWYEPYSIHPRDVEAARNHLDFECGWYMDPFIFGDYPSIMKENVRGLPEFTEEQKQKIKNAWDYIGINYYTGRFAKQVCQVDSMQGIINFQYVQSIVDIDENKIGEPAKGQSEIYVYPDGLRKLLIYIKDKYGDPELYVTENGVSGQPDIHGSVPELIAQGKTDVLEEAFFDDYRISHTESHLTAIREAIKAGANVKGYFVWSLMDNMEVGAGYKCRFGLNYVDYLDNHKRYQKKSAVWFANFLKETKGSKASDDVKLKGMEN